MPVGRQRRLRRGSMRPRRPSPVRLRARTRKTMANHGKIDNQGASRMSRPWMAMRRSAVFPVIPASNSSRVPLAST